MNMRLFDSHCHVDEARFDEDRGAVHDRMAEAGVRLCTVVGSDMATSRHAMEYAASHSDCLAAVGIHPHEASTMAPGDLETLRKMLAAPRVVALGEIGLDYYYDYSSRDVQREVLIRQLDLACELDVPVIYHIRDAHGDMMDLMRSRKGRLPSGIIHCFSGSWEVAKFYLNQGYYISFAGPVTFKKAPHLQDAARQVPLDRLLIETDSPYLSPEPNRGRRNEPSYVRYVAETIARLREIPLEELAEKTFQNALRVYRLEGANEPS